VIFLSHIIRLIVELITFGNMNLALMNIQLNLMKKFIKLIILMTALSLMAQCGLYKKTDARKVPVNAKERVQKNLEEGRRIKFGQLSGKGSGNFEFASSNEMWRATIDVLDFLPLASVDYGGGVIITDWYTEDNNKSSLKIMVQFLSNEVRADGLKITVYNKNCEPSISNCLTSVDESSISEELKLAILKKAAQYKTLTVDAEVEEYRKKNKGKPSLTGGEGRDPKNVN